MSKSSCSKDRRYDVLVVGMGSTTTPCIRRLLDAKYRVLCLEAGYNYNNDSYVLQNGATVGTATATLLNQAPYSYVVNAQIVGPAPKATTATAALAFGGTSIHNYMTAFRPTPQVVDQWAQLTGDRRWAYKNYRATLKAVEAYTPDGSVADYEERGADGRTGVIQIVPPATYSDPIVAWATAGTDPMGFLADYNDPKEGTVGWSASQRLNGRFPFRRSAAALDWLQDVMDWNGNGEQLTTRSGTYVSRILFDTKKGRCKPRAIGVEYYRGDDPNDPPTYYRAHADLIIVGAGALHSAGILERSGVGDPAILTPLGIPVLVANPNVGANMQEQYGPTPVMNTPDLTLNAPSGSSLTVPMDLRGQGYPADGTRRYVTFVTPSNTGTTGTAKFGGWLTESQSLGSVHIQSASPRVDPAVTFSAFTDGPYTQVGTDAHKCVAFLNQVYQWSQAVPGYSMSSPPDSTFEAGPSTVWQWLLANYAIQGHYYGTTRMSRDKRSGVIGGKLFVHGVRGVMVADVGCEPVASDGNPCLGAYSLGYEAGRIAIRYLKRRRGRACGM